MDVIMYSVNFKISVEENNTLAIGNKHSCRFGLENSMWLADTLYLNITFRIVYYSLVHI
jgi:hypothetical protein